MASSEGGLSCQFGEVVLVDVLLGEIVWFVASLPLGPDRCRAEREHSPHRTWAEGTPPASAIGKRALFKRFRYHKTSAPDGKSSTRPTSS
jgi:hypothetical protein